MPRHFLDLLDSTPESARSLLERALALKRAEPGGLRAPKLAGRVLGLVFDKPSMRTRVSFEAAMAQLAGSAIYLDGKNVGLGAREPLSDFAKVISHYVDALAVRTFAQSTIQELAAHASIPVINALTDNNHPCQAMADLLTILEAKGSLEDVRIAFVGDGNNVARSLAVACALTGVRFILSCPKDYRFSEDFQRAFARAFPRVTLEIEHDPNRAVIDADVVYTDVWCSMGQEEEAQSRRRAFESFRVDNALMKRAKPDALFLHCLPARRGEEVAPEVIDGPKSRVIEQAGNRLHFQKALLLELIDPEDGAPV